MSNVSLVIYGVAALWGVQMLLTSMEQHRRRTLLKLQREEIARREGEASAAQPEVPQAPEKTAVKQPPVVTAAK